MLLDQSIALKLSNQCYHIPRCHSSVWEMNFSFTVGLITFLPNAKILATKLLSCIQVYISK